MLYTWNWLYLKSILKNKVSNHFFVTKNKVCSLASPPKEEKEQDEEEEDKRKVRQEKAKREKKTNLDRVSQRQSPRSLLP